MNKSVVDIAAGDDRFETLVQAVQAADLAETLSGEGPFTVFAPTDEAFANLPEGTVENLLKPENRDQLRAILTYHVVPEEVPSSAIAGKTLQADTVNGKPLGIDASGGGVEVGNANVVAADVSASNGVIHVVDTVIMPPES
ncbi:fasciclin domain-containing protein [Rhodovibrio sodomensis]|nr:fasciclin domain-containing protein [Rhodovibrio sodomensis]